MAVNLVEFFKNMSLLYAEDDIVAQTIYEDYFQQYFNTLYLAENGQQALEIYKEKRPDIVILDINMPLLSGLGVCKAIRKEDKETKIILLTSRSDKQAFLEAVELGLTTYLEKPVKIEQLNQAMFKLSAEFQDTSKISLYQSEDEFFHWDKIHRELHRNLDIIPLTKKEKLLLELLVTTHHNKLSNENIYNAVWFEDYCNQKYHESSIKTLINKLRAKLPPKIIKNAYGLGYYLDKLNDSHQ